MNRPFICNSYVCVSCIDGTCPMANSEIRMEYGIPFINNCNECSYYKGCSGCDLFNTECCFCFSK